MKKPKSWPIEMAETVLSMHDGGKRLRDICERFNIHHSQVQQFLRDNDRAPHPRALIVGAQREEVVRLYECEQMSARQIAKIIGVSDSTIREVLHDSEVSFRSRSVLDPGQQSLACGLYISGVSYPQIAKQFGCSEEVVRDVLHRHDISIRPKRKLDPRSIERITAQYDSGLTPARIGAEYKVNENTIKNALLLHGHILRGVRDDVHRQIPLDIHAFEQDTEDAKYWIGFAIADGSVNRYGTFSVALQAADIGHLEKLKSFLKSGARIMTGKLNRTAYKPGAEFAKLSVASKILVDSLMSAGVVPRKTGKEKLLKHQLSRHTWRGAIDGDGSLGWHKRGYFWIKLYGSRQLCSQFRRFVLTLVPGCRAKVQRSGSIYAFGICCGPAEVVARELYRDCKVSLERKHRIVLRLFE